MTPSRTGRRLAATALLLALAAVLLVSLGVDPVAMFGDAPAPVDSSGHAAAARLTSQQPSDQPPTTPTDPVQRTAVTDGAPRDERWLLHGVVQTEGDRGVGGAKVSLLAMPGGDERVSEHLPLSETRTAADGTFVLSYEGLQQVSEMMHADTTLHVVADAEGYELGSNEIDVEILRDSLEEGQRLRVRLKVYPARLLKGRVVTADGKPVPEVNVVCVGLEDQVWSETWVDGTFELNLSDSKQREAEVHVIAAHFSYGRSRPLAVQLRDVAEQRCQDLVLQPGRQGIRGQVRWPDGRPAALVDLTFEYEVDEDDESTVYVDGVPVEGYHQLLNPDGTSVLDVYSDRDGRFVLHDLRVGTYTAYTEAGPERAIRVVAGRATDVVFEVGATDEEEQAQLFVDVIDGDGRRLAYADYGCRYWTGEEAHIAAAQYARVGPTLDLMATAEESDFGNQGQWPVLGVEPETFCLVEASYHDAGPVYAAAMIHRGQRRADVRLVLEPRTDTGGLRFVATMADGRPAQQLWIRFARGDDDLSVPVHVPSLERRHFDGGRLRGYWLTLTEDMTVRGLPAGELTVELMFEPTGKRQDVLCMHPTLLQRVHVAPGAITAVPVRAPRGAPLVVRVDGAERRHRGDPRLYRILDDGGYQRVEAFHPSRGSYGYDPDAVTITTMLSYPPGRYTLELRARHYQPRRKGDVQVEHEHRIGGGPAVVSVHPR